MTSALLVAVMVTVYVRPRVSSQVTAASIRKISIGMTRAAVVSILGQPLQERDAAGGGVLLDYGIPGAALHGTFAFWIGLDRDGTVDIVHVEKHPWVADHFAVYEARREWPVYEHPDFAKVIDGAR